VRMEQHLKKLGILLGTPEEKQQESNEEQKPPSGVQ
jgi:hypothetical protein